MKTDTDITGSIKQYIAAKAIISNDAGGILLLKQSLETDVYGAGRYHPPGGIVEIGETLHDALQREIKEEINLEVSVGRIIDVGEWQVAMRGDICYFVGVFYECKIKNGILDVDKEESSGFAWVNKDSFQSLDVLQPSRRVIENYFTAQDK